MNRIFWLQNGIGGFNDFSYGSIIIYGLIRKKGGCFVGIIECFFARKEQVGSKEATF